MGSNIHLFDRFFSVFKSQAKHNGMKYTLLKEVDETNRQGKKIGTMYVIQLENGDKIQALEEEINGDYAIAFENPPITG